MVIRSRKSKKKRSMRRGDGNSSFGLSPFPKPLVRPRPGPAVGKKGSRIRPKVHSNRMCRVNIKHKKFVERPKRRELRIRQSIDHSIRSHIDRLTQHRYDSMLKSSDNRCCPVGLCSYSNYSEPVRSSKPKTTNYGVSKNKPTVMGTNRVTIEPVKVKKTHKSEKEQEIRTINFENYGPDTANFDEDIKNLTESVQNFEKQRMAFLQSLANIHSQVSNLRVPPASVLKENVEKEMMKRNALHRLREEEQQRMAEENARYSTSTTTPISFRNESEIMRRLPKHKKKPQAQVGTRPKLKNLNSMNIMDNLSKLLMNTAQRPTNKVNNEMIISKLPMTVQNSLNMKGLSSNLQPGRLMNLAQSFCSAMTTAF